MDDDMPPEATAVLLPDDVIFDILSRTPVKSVCRFQFVSKGWRDRIRSPAFLAAHKSRHSEPFLVDTGYFRGNIDRADLRLMDMDGNIVKIIEGVGGFKMLPTTSLDDLVFVSKGSCGGAHVVDPASREVLFTTTGLDLKAIMQDMHFTSFWPYETFGIGRTTASDVYKVVRLVGDDIACDVLTLDDINTGWRRKPRPKPIREYVLDMSCSPATINGAMYFLTEKLSSDEDTLLCFDLKSEQWMDEPIIGPGNAEMLRSIQSVYITELNGALCMVQEEYVDPQMRQHPPNLCTNIWILDNSDKSTNWTKAYTIRMGIIGCHYIPLRVMRGGEKLLLQYIPIDMCSSAAALQVYDPRTETCTNIMGTPGYLPGRICLCCLHLEHLVSVKN